MTLQQFLSILAGRRRLILAVWIAVVALAAGLSLVLPKRYAATASVVVDVKSPDPILGASLPALTAPAYMATQLDIIQSDRVAQKVVRALKIDQDPKAVAEWREETGGRGSVTAHYADLLQKNLDVRPSRDSNVIAIGFRGLDPAFAAAVANAYAQAYIDTTLELKVDPARQYARWFDQRTRALREAVEAAQVKLARFQKDKGILANDERLDVENARLAELSSQLVAVQGQKAESQSRQAAAGGAPDTMQEVLQNPLIQSLKSDLSRQEGKLQDLSAELGPNHPQVQRARAERAATAERLEAETRKLRAGIATANRVNQEREAQIRASLDAQKDKLLRLKHQRDELAVLQKDVENAQRSYDLVTQRLAQTSLESQSQQTNIAVLSPAVEPVEPASPRLVLNVAIALVVGALLGVALALLLESANRRVRSAEDLSEVLDLPVLGVLERARRRRMPVATMRKAWLPPLLRGDPS